MAEKDDVIRKLDMEIEAFIEASKNEPSGSRMKKLEYYTALRNELDIMPIQSPRINSMLACKNLLQMADRTFILHDESTALQKDYDSLAYWLVSDVYHMERASKISERLNAENNEYLENLKEQPPQTIIDNAYQIVFRNEILNHFVHSPLLTREIDALLTFENTLNALYDSWISGSHVHDSEIPEFLKEEAEQQDAYLQRQEFLTEGKSPSEDVSIWNAMYDGEDFRYPDDMENEDGEDMEL